MMGRRRRSTCRFGIGQAVTSITAMAILALAPAVGSLADSRLNGIALTVAEAVFGEPVCAQSGDCLDRDGKPRQCTATEKGAKCLKAVEDSLQQCLDETPWYLQFMCWATAGVDAAACGIEYVGTLIPL